MKIVCQNRKAYHDYDIQETFEAGISLLGTEVKSLREGKANLKDSYVIIKNKEVFLINCHIGQYSHGNIMNHDPLRTRKLLLHRKEIERLRGKTAIRGFTLIPLKMYFKGSFAKLEIGLAKGKRLFEKREALKEKEARREMERGRKGSTEAMKLRKHVVGPSPRGLQKCLMTFWSAKLAETNTNANNELALAA